MNQAMTMNITSIYAADNFMKRKSKGFTLFEMLLVLVIMTSILLMMLNYMTTKFDESKRDRAVVQMEQILNAGLAYFVNYGKWPSTSDDAAAGATTALEVLQNAGYLPLGPIRNPWGGDYIVPNYNSASPTDPMPETFKVCTTIATNNATIEAGVVKGRLPISYISGVAVSVTDSNCPDSTTVPCTVDCPTVVASVNIPGQNLNNARSINFAGIYRHGACVPVPKCPDVGGSSAEKMKPAIFVVPMSISGQNYFADDSSAPDGVTKESIFPIESFTAYATLQDEPENVPSCANSSQSGCLDEGFNSIPNDGEKKFWRVCAQVFTEAGEITFPNTPSAESPAVLMAITRCVPDKEPAGTGFCVSGNC